MKHLLLATAALIASATMALADPVLGRWSTTPDDNGNSGIIEITACGDRFCGTLIQSRRANGDVFESPNNGRRIIWDMAPEGNGEYGGGQIWAPDRDQTYRSNMTLRGDQLSVEGCFLVICRAQNWTRMR